MTPILDIRKPASQRWLPVVRAQREQWLDAAHSLRADIGSPLLRSAARLRATLFPRELNAELRSVASALGIDLPILMAAQVLYDEIWAACKATPQCGCTSVSTDGGFGRNLDWGYPDNAADLITRITVVDRCGREYLAEGFAGILGWLAICGESAAMSLNQAPCLRRINRTAAPALWWFRELLNWGYLPPTGESVLARPPGADILVHAQVGDVRYIGETFGKRMRVKAVTGKAVQANTYQLFNLRAEKEWEIDSKVRMGAARRARSIQGSLNAAAVKGWTVDQFVMR